MLKLLHFALIFILFSRSDIFHSRECHEDQLTLPEYYFAFDTSERSNPQIWKYRFFWQNSSIKGQTEFSSKQNDKRAFKMES